MKKTKPLLAALVMMAATLLSVPASAEVSSNDDNEYFAGSRIVFNRGNLTVTGNRYSQALHLCAEDASSNTWTLIEYFVDNIVIYEVEHELPGLTGRVRFSLKDGDDGLAIGGVCDGASTTVPPLLDVFVDLGRDGGRLGIEDVTLTRNLTVRGGNGHDSIDIRNSVMEDFTTGQGGTDLDSNQDDVRIEDSVIRDFANISMSRKDNLFELTDSSVGRLRFRGSNESDTILIDNSALGRNPSFSTARGSDDMTVRTTEDTYRGTSGRLTARLGDGDDSFHHEQIDTGADYERNSYSLNVNMGRGTDSLTVSGSDGNQESGALLRGDRLDGGGTTRGGGDTLIACEDRGASIRRMVLTQIDASAC